MTRDHRSTMTQQEFAKSYQLIRQVTAGDVVTHYALASTGAVVMVHRVRPEAIEQLASLLGLIDRLTGADRQRVLQIDDVDGVPFIVTRFLLDFSSLDAWLESATGERSPAAPRAESEPRVTGQRPAPDAAPGPNLTPAAPAAPVEPGEEGRGEFTRIFGAARSPADIAGAGEFTRLFGTPVGVRQQVGPDAVEPEPTSDAGTRDDYLARLSGAAPSPAEIEPGVPRPPVTEPTPTPAPAFIAPRPAAQAERLAEVAPPVRFEGPQSRTQSRQPPSQVWLIVGLSVVALATVTALVVLIILAG